MAGWFGKAAALLICVGVGMTVPSAVGSVRADESPCRMIDFAANAYVVCSVDPEVDELRLFWKGPEGQPFRTFRAVEGEVRASGRSLAFAVNAGMYMTDFTPMGLYIEAGEQGRPLNVAQFGGDGAVPNFYRMPNGVFFTQGGAAAIMTTEDYASADQRPEIATQSGPMLVIDGHLHPALIDGSTDRRRRSGIGVCEGGKVIVAVSEGAVNFYDFATLFKEQFQCPNALYLDGGRGVGLFDPALGRDDFSWHGGYGPMLGLVR